MTRWPCAVLSLLAEQAPATDLLGPYSGLIQMGGGFVALAVVLWLHRDSIKAFREELTAERTANLAINERILDKIDTKHAEALGVLQRIETAMAGRRPA